MADREQSKLAAEDKFADELGALVRFLDPHLKARADAKSAGKQGLWSWRKTIAFILVTGLAGWAVILGAIYLLSRLWN